MIGFRFDSRSCLFQIGFCRNCSLGLNSLFRWVFCSRNLGFKGGRFLRIDGRLGFCRGERNFRLGLRFLYFLGLICWRRWFVLLLKYFRFICGRILLLLRRCQTSLHLLFFLGVFHRFRILILFFRFNLVNRCGSNLCLI